MGTASVAFWAGVDLFVYFNSDFFWQSISNGFSKTNFICGGITLYS
jgi:hypothetical protein